MTTKTANPLRNQQTDRRNAEVGLAHPRRVEDKAAKRLIGWAKKAVEEWERFAGRFAAPGSTAALGIDKGERVRPRAFWLGALPLVIGPAMAGWLWIDATRLPARALQKRATAVARDPSLGKRRPNVITAPLRRHAYGPWIGLGMGAFGLTMLVSSRRRKRQP